MHRVSRGETIWHVARTYRIDVQSLAEFNAIEDPREAKVGMQLRIPPRPKKPGYKHLYTGASKGRFKKGSKRGKKNNSTLAMRGAVRRDKIEVNHGKFIWPVQGAVVSRFGMRNGRRHDGVDIKAAVGERINAAGNGKVVFSGQMRGYGKLILLRHKDNFFTSYAHNDKNFVKKGQSVKQGQKIGLVGRTGRTTGPHLHFEIRKGQIARNPQFFLPKRRK